LSKSASYLSIGKHYITVNAFLLDGNEYEVIDDFGDKTNLGKKNHDDIGIEVAEPYNNKEQTRLAVRSIIDTVCNEVYLIIS
jgi:hypothetical protein